MPKKPWKVVDTIIKESDLILEIVDARFPDTTRNSVIEGKINKSKKKFFYVLNKVDLVDAKQVRKGVNLLKDIAPVIPFSAKEFIGKNKLMTYIKRFAGKKSIKVGVVGYPNIGKSSVINILRGKKAAVISPIAGQTKGKQWIRLTKDILLIDTPGVIPGKEKSTLKLVMKQAITSIKDPEGTATDLLEELCKKGKEAIEEFYNIKVQEDPYDTLQEIAKVKKKLKKGGKLDLDSAGRLVINDWQRGKIKIII